MSSYCSLAERLSHISGKKFVSVEQLRQFEQRQGKPMTPVMITKMLSGYSGTHAPQGYDATFELHLNMNAGTLRAQRIYYHGERTPEETVRETLDALLRLYDEFVQGSRSARDDYNII